MLVPWDITSLLQRFTEMLPRPQNFWCTWPWKANTHVGIKIISLPPTSPKKRCQTTLPLGSYKTSTVRPNPSTHWSIQVKVPCSLPRRYRAWRLPGSYRPPRVFFEGGDIAGKKQQTTVDQKKIAQGRKTDHKKQVQWTVTWQWNICWSIFTTGNSSIESSPNHASWAIFKPSRAASSAVSLLLHTRLALANVRSAPA